MYIFLICLDMYTKRINHVLLVSHIVDFNVTWFMKYFNKIWQSQARDMRQEDYHRF